MTVVPKRAKRLLLLPVFALGRLGCIEPCPPEPEFPDEEFRMTFSYQGGPLYIPMEAGSWGYRIWIRGFPEWVVLPRSKAILNGPGCLYHVTWDYSDFEATGHGVQKEYPWEEIADTYYSDGMRLFYRPPSNEDVPPEGVDVTFACEALNPITEKWDRSPDYTRRVVRRSEQMDFWLRPDGNGYWGGDYGPDNSLSELTVASGEKCDLFSLRTEPIPADDYQLRIDLSGPEGKRWATAPRSLSPMSARRRLTPTTRASWPNAAQNADAAYG
jgi:hypothetical protein